MTAPTRDPRLDMAMKYYNAQLDDDAWRVVREIVSEPNPPFAALQFAASLRYEARDLDAAIEFCDRALKATPDEPHILLIKGRAQLDRGESDAAVSSLAHAAAIDPNRAAIRYSHGLALEAIGRLAEAEIAYRAAVALQDPYPVAWNNLGNVLDALGRPADAVAALKTAIAQLPGYSIAHNNLGATLAGQGRFAAAAAEYTEALACDPDNLAARVNLGVAEVERGHADLGRLQFEAALKASPGHRAARSNLLFSMNNYADRPDVLAAAHRTPGTSTVARPAVRNPDPTRRIRVGYVSGDFRRHSVAFFIEPLFRHHSDAVEVFAYANVATPDAVTQRLEAHVAHWRSIAGLSTEKVLEVIGADGIDILVDLSGHTQANRLDVFERRPAPVQVTGVGYPGSTGLEVFEGRLCDAATDPPANDVYSSELPLRLESGMHCYAPPEDAPTPSSRSEGPIVFGSFNKLAKLSDATVVLWAQVLQAVPGSRLALKSKPLAEAETCGDVAARFARVGIGRDRLIMASWLPDDRDHLAAYHGVDIALDTFPYNGTTTTCEALWMGVPVVTLCGNVHASRVGASLLTSVGLADWIAADADRYVAIAQQIAQDRAALSAARQDLRQKVAMSRLCHGPGYAIAVEAAYRRLWSEACRRVT